MNSDYDYKKEIIVVDILKRRNVLWLFTTAKHIIQKDLLKN